MWVCESELGEGRLRREGRRGEDELLVRVAVRVDSRIDRGPTVVETDVWVKSHRQRAQYVGAFVGEQAQSESQRELCPIPGRPTRCYSEGRCLLGRQLPCGQHHCTEQSDADCDCAATRQTYFGFHVLHAERCTDG